jgi:predicted AAA+ superfamily ATPase
MYLREEIQAEALVRNLPGFARFLPIAALFHGQALNLSSLARDAQVSRTTANGYLEVLEDTLLAFRLPAYETKLRVREKRHPKLYWIDAGIVRSVRGELGPANREELGALFEGWIANLLRIHNDYDGLYDQWGYWSPAEAQRTEVDFVLRRGRELLAIEVKASAQVRDEDLRGLAAIAELPGLVRRVLVCRVERRRKTAAGIEVWPISHFLRRLIRKRKRQNTLRRHPLRDKIGDPMGNDPRFAGSGARENKQGPFRVQNRLFLRLIKAFKKFIDIGHAAMVAILTVRRYAREQSC